jgi:hypothetical protein
MKTKILLVLALVLSGGLFGCSTAVKHPADLPLRYHNAQYDLTFFLPADWKGYSVLIQEWNSTLSSADYQTVIGTEHGPIIVLRNPQWKASQPYTDIPIIVFTRRQWDFAIPQRIFVGAAGNNYEIARNAKYVFGMNSHFNWSEFKGWEETGKIVGQNVIAGIPHLYPDPP